MKITIPYVFLPLIRENWGTFATKIVLLLLSPKSKELEEELPASELLTSLFGVQEPNKDSERVKTNERRERFILHHLYLQSISAI